MHKRSECIVILFTPEDNRMAQRLRMVAAKQLPSRCEGEKPAFFLMQDTETCQCSHNPVQNFFITSGRKREFCDARPTVTNDVSNTELGYGVKRLREVVPLRHLMDEHGW